MTILLGLFTIALGLAGVLSGLKTIKNQKIRFRRPPFVYSGLAAKLFGITVLGFGITVILCTMLVALGENEKAFDLLLFNLFLGLLGQIFAEVTHRRKGE